MGVGSSTQDHLKQLKDTQKLSAELREFIPGTRKYAKLLLSGLRNRYPRGYAFIVGKEELTEEELVDVYINQNHLFIIWLKMMMWCDEYLTEPSECTRETT